MADIPLRILISAQNSASSVIQSLGASLGPVGVAMAAVGVAAIGAGVAAVKMAADYQTGINTLVTGAGESVSAIGAVSQGILAMSVQTGTSTQQLISGMFMIESAGYHAANGGLTVLQVAAEGAKVGNAELGTVANALTTVMTDYSIKATNAAQAMNFLTGIVQNGKTTMQALSASMSSILPTASAVGVHLVDVGAAMATMTGEGTGAEQAATYLRQLLLALSAPAKAGADALKAIGLSTSQVSTEMKVSLPATLQLIMTHLAETYKVGSPQYVAALKAIAGGSKQMQGILQLTGSHLSTFAANVKNVSGVMQQGGKSVVGWSLVQSSFNFKLDQAKMAVEALFIQVGSALLPKLSQLVGAITPVIARFTTWLVSSGALQRGLGVLGTIFGAIGGAIGRVVSIGAGIVNFFRQNEVAALALLIPLGMLSAVLVQMAVTAFVAFLASIPALVTGFIAWAAAAGAAAIATLAATWPILAIGAAIALVVAGIILAVQHWGAIVAWLKGVWGAIAGWFGNLFSQIGTVVHNGVSAIGAFFSGLGTAAHTAVTTVGSWFSHLGTFAHNGITGAQNAFQSGWSAIKNVAQTGAQGVVNAFSWLYNHNYYFKNLVDFIKAMFTQGIAFWRGVWTNFTGWLVSLWNTIKGDATAIWTAVTTFIQHVWTTLVTWLTSLWNNLKALATTVWNAISSAIMTVLNTLWGWLQGWWHQEVTGWTNIWNTVKGLAQSGWNAITGVFSAAWAGISGALSGIWHSISSWFTNLATTAITWGKNIIQGFINGIMSMVGAVGNAAQNIIGTVASFLGFHSPAAMGEGQHIIEWGQNAVKGFVQGMKQAQPQLQAQLNAMIRAPQQAGNTTNISHGPVTLNVSVNMASGSNTEVNQLARNLGDKLRAQFGNI